jgi:hypothetical protein
MVFSESMADSGLSIFSLSRIIASAPRLPCPVCDFRYGTGTDSNTASIIEHKNDVNSAMNKYVNSKVIKHKDTNFIPIKQNPGILK